MKEALAQALAEAAAAAGWKAAHVAATVDKTEAAARRWLKGTADITAPDLLVLMARMPGLRARVLALVDSTERRAAA